MGTILLLSRAAAFVPRAFKSAVPGKEVDTGANPGCGGDKRPVPHNPQQLVLTVALSMPLCLNVTYEAAIAARSSSCRSLMSMRITAEDVLKDPKWPPLWPFTDADFRRQDESSDDYFYDQPRLVFHIDDFAVQARLLQ